MDELLSLKADCVNYNTLIPNVEELERFLESGVNVVGTAAFIMGKIKVSNLSLMLRFIKAFRKARR